MLDFWAVPLLKWSFIVGVISVPILTRLIPSLVLEIAFFGAILAGVEFWHYWFTPNLGFPEVPMFILVWSSGAMLMWILVRLLYVGGIWIPPMKAISLIIAGERGK